MSFPEKIFGQAWITSGNSLWNCNTTYCTVPFKNIPAITRATEDLEWLKEVSPELRGVIHSTSTLNSGDNEIAALENIISEADKLKLSSPLPFLRFMRDASLQNMVPTCTGCFLALSDEFVPVPGADGFFLLRFMNDSQSCVLWYLCMGLDGSAVVVASFYFLERKIFEGMEYEGVKYENAFQEALLCAGGFTEFLFRFWVENTIWYSAHEKLPFTMLQEEYRDQITQDFEHH